MADIVLSDAQIEALLTTPKIVRSPGSRWKTNRGSKQRNFDLESIDGAHKFTLFLRQNMRLPEGFSCGLVFLHPSGEKVVLTRYNG
ncbi:MAG: hypothetical protein LPK85_03960, partial [Gammaproteobacteria bacterium]|nr:hypothetical protein [Gammaproteobacteria bacterium]